MITTQPTPSPAEIDQAVARARQQRSQAFVDAFTWLKALFAAGFAKLRQEPVPWARAA